jgi:hypothetical protein
MGTFCIQVRRFSTSIYPLSKIEAWERTYGEVYKSFPIKYSETRLLRNIF